MGLSQTGSNTWLAIDAATAPTLRAQELRFAWERFLGENDEGDVRGPIVDSWPPAWIRPAVTWLR